MPNENLLRLIAGSSQRGASEERGLKDQMRSNYLRQMQMAGGQAVKQRKAEKQANSPWRKLVSTLGTVGGAVGGGLLYGPMGAMVGMQAGGSLGKGLASTGLQPGYEVGRGMGDYLQEGLSPAMQLLAMRQMRTGQNPWERSWDGSLSSDYKGVGGGKGSMSSMSGGPSWDLPSWDFDPENIA